MVEIILAVMAWMPAEFSQLPDHYHDWNQDSLFYQSGREYHPSQEWKDHFPNYITYDSEDTNHLYVNNAKLPAIHDTALLPFSVHFEGLEHWQAWGDSAYGLMDFMTDTSSRWTDTRHRVTIYWSPPSYKKKIHKGKVPDYLYPIGGIMKEAWRLDLAVQKEYDELSLGIYPAYRHRGRWLQNAGCACGSWDVGGSFTTYLIPSNERLFHITCTTLTWEYDENPWQDYSEEELDTLPPDIRNTWPDPISDLEQAVEQTFRVRD